MTSGPPEEPVAVVVAEPVAPPTQAAPDATAAAAEAQATAEEAKETAEAAADVAVASAEVAEPAAEAAEEAQSDAAEAQDEASSVRGELSTLREEFRSGLSSLHEKLDKLRSTGEPSETPEEVETDIPGEPATVATDQETPSGRRKRFGR